MAIVELQNAFLHWLHAVQNGALRWTLITGSVWLALWVVLAVWLRDRKIREQQPSRAQVLLEIAASLRTVMIFNAVGLSTYLLARLGWLPGPALARSWGAWWFWASLGLMFVGHDTYFYWTHRLMHHPRLFRRFHRRHHRSHNPSPFAAYSFDVAEAIVNGGFVPLWVILVPTELRVVAIFMFFSILINSIGHSGYEIFPARRDGRPLLPWLATVTHHDQHHAKAHWNFGFYFTVWDRAMGTLHPDYWSAFAATVTTRRSLTRGTPQAALDSGPATQA